MSRDANKLDAFVLADGLVLDVYRVTRSFPAEVRFDLRATPSRCRVGRRPTRRGQRPAIDA
jgi:hypothetical protein